MKDEKISNELQNLGIKAIRIQGSEIVNNLEKAVDRILEEVKNNT